MEVNLSLMTGLICDKYQDTFFTKTMIYLDTNKHHAQMLFYERNVRMRNISVASHPDMPYLLMTAKVARKDVSKFLDALKEFPNKALLLGYNDYLEVAEKLRAEYIMQRVALDAGFPVRELAGE